MVLYMEEDTSEKTENVPVGLKTTRRKIKAEGVQLFDYYYYHPAFAAFRDEEVEVRYDVKDFSRVTVVLPDFRTVEATTIAVFNCEGKYTNDEIILQDSMRLTAIEAQNRLMESALWQALEMRGIFAALCDPLTLVGEKVRLQTRYAEIEKNIRKAIIKNGGNQ